MKEKALKKIKFIVFDFDGVFTDNKVIVNEKGEEAVVCTRADGLGLEKLKSLGVETLILSTEKNRVVAQRAKKLKIKCITGCKNKMERLLAEIRKRKIPLSQVAYVGNDINDADCLKIVGLPIVVADAHKDVLPLAALITKLSGGNGAVREVCDLIYRVKKERKS